MSRTAKQAEAARRKLVASISKKLEAAGLSQQARRLRGALHVGQIEGDRGAWLSTIRFDVRRAIEAARKAEDVLKFPGLSPTTTKALKQTAKQVEPLGIVLGQLRELGEI